MFQAWYLETQRGAVMIFPIYSKVPRSVSPSTSCISSVIQDEETEKVISSVGPLRGFQQNRVYGGEQRVHAGYIYR
jgi:hypothetical protein